MPDQERAQRLRQKSLATIARVDAMLRPPPEEDIVAVQEESFDWRTVQVEDQVEKWKREANETAARRAAARRQLKAVEDEGRGRAEAHELAVVEARAKAVADNNNAVLADVLKVISDGLNSMIDRIEALEQRLDRAETNNKDIARRLDFHATHERTQGEQIKKDVGDQIAVLRSDVQFLRVQHSILGAQLQQQSKDPPPTQIIREYRS
jgi:hypothetical protein